MVIYDYSNYRSYLKARLGDSSKRTGAKMAAAEAMRCHTTYLSQVLGDKVDLSLEQADLLNRHFSHTQDESDFFILLVLKARAGTETLKSYFQDKIEEMLKKRLVIKNRISGKATVSLEDESKFYSSWIYGATHVLVSIPSLQTKEALAAYLHIPMDHVGEILEFLQKVGMIKQVGSRFRHTEQFVHLGQDSSNLSKHHTNWRLRTLQSIERNHADNLHYSAAISLSKSDAQKIKESLIANLKQNLETVKKSKEEVAFGYCFDFFSLDK